MGFDKKLNRKILSFGKKIYMVNLLGGKCACCGDTRFYVMNFHHDLEKYEKEYNVNKLINGRLSLILEELSKCKLLCANCHQLYHRNATPITKIVEKRITTKNTLLQYKNQCGCQVCGEKEQGVLVFHHLRDKSFCISQWMTNKHIKTIDDMSLEIKEELDKCIVLCQNCHLEIHHDKEFCENHKEEILICSENIRENSKPLDKEKVKEMFLSGMRQVDIVKHFQCAKSTVCDILKTFGLTVSVSDKMHNRQKILELHAKGYSNIEISEELNITKGGVSRIILSLGLEPNIKKSRIISKFDLTKEQLLEELKQQTVEQISKKYDVAIQTVYKKMRTYSIKTK